MVTQASPAVLAGEMDLIETQNPSGVSSVDFTTGIDDTFSEYVFLLRGLRPSSDGSNFDVRVSSDGGSNFDNGASDYQQNIIRNDVNGSLSSANTNIDFIRLTLETEKQGSGTSETGNGILRFYEPSVSSQRTLFLSKYVYHSTSSNLLFITGSYQRSTSSAIDAIRFFVDSGNIASGEISLYGINS